MTAAEATPPTTLQLPKWDWDRKWMAGKIHQLARTSRLIAIGFAGPPIEHRDYAAPSIVPDDASGSLSLR